MLQSCKDSEVVAESSNVAMSTQTEIVQIWRSVQNNGGILSTLVEKVTTSGARKHNGSLPGPVESKGNFVASADAALMPSSVNAQGTGGKKKLGRP